MKKVVFIGLLLAALSGCKKDKPPVGSYSGEFFYDGYTVKVEEITVEESSEDAMVINGYSFEKDDRSIKGTFEYLDPFDYPVEISGTWKKKKEVYMIEGEFSTTIAVKTGPGEWEYSKVSGTFVIKSS